MAASFAFDPLYDLALFFAGAFLCNTIPHTAAGLMGFPHPTPFANPHGKGMSSPFVNFIWGSFNFAVGLYLLWTHPFVVDLNAATLAIALGYLLLGVYLSVHFGRVRAGKA